VFVREQYHANEFFGIEASFLGVSNIAKPYRYGFQGQEKDDEVKGEGNSINYKYRMHDPRIGRFFAVDPLAGDYPYNSPYAFSENVVIHAIELEGLEKVVLFGGADWKGDGSTGRAGDIADEIVNNSNQLGLETEVILVNSNYWNLTEAVIEARKEVMADLEPGEPVAIYGYSRGGVYAIMLANELENQGVTVDLLFTVDAADGFTTFLVDREISSNVEENINYYQRNPSAIRSRGGANTKKDEDSSVEIKNIDLTDAVYPNESGENVDIIHSTIDDATWKIAVKAIMSVIDDSNAE